MRHLSGRKWVSPFGEIRCSGTVRPSLVRISWTEKTLDLFGEIDIRNFVSSLAFKLLSRDCVVELTRG